jgi:hypothetical protein
MTSRKKDAYLSDWKQPGFAVLFWSQSECSWQYTPSSTHAAQCNNRSRGVKSDLHFSWIRGLIRRDVLARLLRRDAKVGFAWGEG